MPLGSVIGAAIMATLALSVLLMNGRREPERPRYAVTAARIRGAGYLTLATALLISGTDALWVAGLLLFTGVGVVWAAAVVALRGQRATRRNVNEM